MNIPKRLGRPPLIEAIFEMRFRPAATGGAELLPGVLFSKLHPQFSEANAVGMGTVPSELVKQHPELRYAAQMQLKGGDRILQLGSQVVSLHATLYPGWERFREECKDVAAAVTALGLLGPPERFSVKYANVIEHPPGKPLAALNLIVDAAGIEPSPNGFRLRMETRVGETTTIFECASNATAKSPPREGLLLTLDTIRNIDDSTDFIQGLPGLLDELHGVLEDFFFRLVSADSLKSFEPIWE